MYIISSPLPCLTHYCTSLSSSYACRMHDVPGICETVLLEGPGRGRGKDAGNHPLLLSFLSPLPSPSQPTYTLPHPLTLLRTLPYTLFIL